MAARAGGGLTLEQLWHVVVPAAVLLFVLGHQLSYVDLGYHLRAGRWMVTHGELLDRDVFSSTFFGRDWINQNWLSQLLFYEVWRRLGIEGLLTVNALAFAAGFLVLLRVCVSRAGSVRIAAVACLVAAAPSVLNSGVRPQSLSWLLAATVVALLDASERHAARALWIAPLLALWVNLHGAFFVGLMFVALACAGSVWDRLRDRSHRRRAAFLTATLAFSVLATLANPWGVRVYTYVASVGRNPIVRRSVEEWRPPAVGDLAGTLFFGSVAVVAAALLWSPARPRRDDAVRTIACLGLGLLAIRNGLWWTVAAAPLLATLLGPLAAPRAGARLADALRRGLASLGGGRGFRWTPRPAAAPAPRPDPPRLVHAGIAAAVAALVVASSPWLRGGFPPTSGAESRLVDPDTPAGAAAYVRSHDLPGEMLNGQEFGSYLEWAAPAAATFVDSRIEMFPPGLWDDYATLMSADPGWRAIASRHEVGYAVLDAHPRPALADALERAPGWRRAFRDEVAVVYAREQP